MPLFRKVHRIKIPINIFLSYLGISWYLLHHKNALLLEILALSYFEILIPFTFSMAYTEWTILWNLYGILYGPYDMRHISCCIRSIYRISFTFHKVYINTMRLHHISLIKQHETILISWFCSPCACYEKRKLGIIYRNFNEIIKLGVKQFDESSP